MHLTPTTLIYWTVGGIASTLTVGYLASIIFFLWFGYDPDTARPWSIALYFFYYWRDPSLHLPFAVSILAPVAGLVFILVGPLFRPKPIYGDAKWASEREMQKAGLRDKQGVLLGKKGGRFICSDSATHTLLVGPTRAGKGTGVVVPNCLNWSGSLLVLDVKGENYRITAGYRTQHGHQVFFWSPMAKDNRSHRFNPLEEISKDPAHRVSDVQVMATLLVDVSDRDPMWGQEARALFVAVTLYVLEKRDAKTLGEVYRVLASNADLRDVCRHVINTTPRLSAEARRGLGSFAAKGPKEAASVRSNLQAALRIFENPVVDAATAASDFSLRDLRRRRMSIYVGALASQLDAIAPLLRLFFQQAIAIMSEREPGPEEPHKVLMLLDEFASLGAMDAVVNAFTLLAGYNVRILAVLQGLSWMDRNYGRDTREGLLSCCGNQVLMTTNDETTTAYVSQALGDRTVSTSSVSRKSFSFTRDAPSRNTSQTGRPLMSKQEIRKLDSRKQIILVEGHPPTLANKIRYFKDSAFKSRLVDDPEVPLLKLTPRQETALGSNAPAHHAANPAPIDDDGGQIVPVPGDATTEPPAPPAPQRSNGIVPQHRLPTVPNSAFVAAEEALLAVVQEEAAANPTFAATRKMDIDRLREMDTEALL